MSRSAELRKKNRRIFAISLVVAAAIHVLIFVASPEFQVESPWSSTSPEPTSTVSSVAEGTLHLVDVFFGPPEILADDGAIWQEPPERVLEARQISVGHVYRSEECLQRPREAMVPAEARVRIRLDAAGRVVRERVAESSGDPCRDEMMTAIASTLWYHWIPNDRFPAPVDLIQPMRVVAAE